MGMTSFSVVFGLKKFLKIKKIGHGGTLDPDASGVLPIYLGKATKITPFLSDTIKEYQTCLCLGIVTDTQDASGAIMKQTENISLSQEQIHSVLHSFTGEIEQTPPMFSALKYKGKPLYHFARKGIEIERKSRKISIHQLICQKFNPPYLNLKVVCSKGTYIRTLCADIGEKLGVGGHMHSLQRLRVGKLLIEKAVPYQNITRDNVHTLVAENLYTIDQALHFLPALKISTSAGKKAINGMPLCLDEITEHPPSFQKGDLLRGYNLEHFLGIFEALGHSQDLSETRPLFKSKRILINREDN